MRGDKKKTWRPNPQTLIGDCEEESELINEMDDLTQASGNKVRVIDYLLLDDNELESLIWYAFWSYYYHRTRIK